MKTAICLAAWCLMLPAQQDRWGENWYEVAKCLGGSGQAPNGEYRLLMKCDAWGTGNTPPIWIRFCKAGGERVLRVALPIASSQVEDAQKAMSGLSRNAKVVVRPVAAHPDRRLLRTVAKGDPTTLARRLAQALDQLNPGTRGRVAGEGVVKRPTMECEPYWAIALPRGEELAILSPVPKWLRKGMTVRFSGHRHGWVPNPKTTGQTFGYFGGWPSQWSGEVKLSELMQIKERPRPATGTERDWLEACRRHAEALKLRKACVPLPSGFDQLDGPGFIVCPHDAERCRMIPMTEDAHPGQAKRLLYASRNSARYFLVQEGQTYGPFFPRPATERR